LDNVISFLQVDIHIFYSKPHGKSNAKPLVSMQNNLRIPVQTKKYLTNFLTQRPEDAKSNDEKPDILQTIKISSFVFLRLCVNPFLTYRSKKVGRTRRPKVVEGGALQASAELRANR
jgi:hypothetical protein